MKFPKQWIAPLKGTFAKPETRDLFAKVDKLYQTGHILPDREDVFNALKLTTPEDVKVVIIGQDPYPDPRYPMGLSFSVRPGVAIPRSLQNIFKERFDDLGIKPSDNGDLSAWAKQGVLLLNSILTVHENEPASHQKLGWQNFTNDVIECINAKQTPVVFILWGAFAKQYAPKIKNPHKIIMSSHPSPFSADRGFFGSRPFSRTNMYLTESNQTPIDWNN